MRSITSSGRWSPELTQKRRRWVVCGVVERLDDAHQVRRRSAEAGAARLCDLVEQAAAEEEPGSSGGAAAVGHQRQEVADAAREVGRRVDEDAVVGGELEPVGHQSGVGADGAQPLADALGQAGRARREHDHGKLVGRDRNERVEGLERRLRQVVGRHRAGDAEHRLRPSWRRRAGPPPAPLAPPSTTCGSRLGDQPVEVGGRQGRVERHDHPAGQPHGEHGDEEIVVRVEQQRHAVAAGQPAGDELAGERRRAAREAGVAVRAALRGQQRPLRAASGARSGVSRRRYPPDRPRD